MSARGYALHSVCPQLSIFDSIRDLYSVENRLTDVSSGLARGKNTVSVVGREMTLHRVLSVARQ